MCLFFACFLLLFFYVCFDLMYFKCLCNDIIILPPFHYFSCYWLHSISPMIIIYAMKQFSNTHINHLKYNSIHENTMYTIYTCKSKNTNYVPQITILNRNNKVDTFFITTTMCRGHPIPKLPSQLYVIFPKQFITIPLSIFVTHIRINLSDGVSTCKTFKHLDTKYAI